MPAAAAAAGGGGGGEDGEQEQQAADVLVAAVWDPYRSHRVFGVTAGGELVALLVPAGPRAIISGVAAFVPGSAAAGSGIFGGGSGGAAAAADASSDNSSGRPVDWVKMLQPVVVVMMIVVGMWQFMRASSNNSIRRASAAARGELYGSDFGQGLAAMSPEDLGQMGLWGSRALDRDFGDYGGRRGGSGSRQRGNSGSRARGQDAAGSLFDSGYAGLNAAGARRRARAVMLGRERHQPAATISSTAAGLDSSMRQLTRPLGSTAVGGELEGSTGGVGSSSSMRQAVQRIVQEPRRVSGNARHHVRFSTEYEVLGEDDIGRVPVTASRYEEADEPQQLQQGLQESPVGRSSTPDSEISALESGELLTSSAGAEHAAGTSADDNEGDALVAESFEVVEQELLCRDMCSGDSNKDAAAIAALLQRVKDDSSVTVLMDRQGDSK
eukprot:gene7970-8168_t